MHIFLMFLKYISNNNPFIYGRLGRFPGSRRQWGWSRKPVVGQRIRARGWLLRLSFSLIGVSLIYRSDDRRAMKPIYRCSIKFPYESMVKSFRSDVQGYP